MASEECPRPKRIKLDVSDAVAHIVGSTVVSEKLNAGKSAEDGEKDGQNTVVTAIVDSHPEADDERWIHLLFTWSGKPFTLDIAESDRVYDLKALLQSLTDVPPERQKILGLVKGKLPPDEERIGDLKLVSGKKFTLVGTPQGHEIKDPSQLEYLPDVFNDLDVDFSANPDAAREYINDQRNQRKIREYTSKLNINVIHPLREGKRLLVLDIDYTILDTKPLTSGALPPHECARPRLHEFLEAVYPHYDICIWSQTSWIWLETKLVELGMLGAGRNYQISFVLDKTSMFTVFSKREGKMYKHSVKALQIIWNHFPQYNASNTLHVDDLGRNFALNPGEGLKIPAFKDAHTTRAMADRELDKLARYMVHIATIHEDFRYVNHKDWQLVARALPP
ncbi:HAD IIID h [Laetiporus sulphureus 93-53]|uniref:protein-serine/threonine phosphatase n=1 Tax=Laetiporus sulphureus 93-53 TaxID=1314785 RepID=A0A165G3Q7_9APHY|nr:HAD IIID h [Laetiporus sulphureus 93-53]KZT09786.1 HAD IIID h [Laetiporus sulphureus 93-53]